MDYYKNLIAKKEAYYQDLENQLKLTQQEQKEAELFSVIYTSGMITLSSTA